MPKSRESEVDVARLCQAMRTDRLALRYYREEFREATRQYVGKRWSEEGTLSDIVLNLISQYVQIVVRSLIAKNPRVLLSTFLRPHKPTVSAMQEWANPEIERMHLANTLKRAVHNALFSLGVVKVALATPPDAAHLAWNLKAGEPFAASIDLDDWVHDMHARDWTECSYMGHRFRVPLEAVKDDKNYSKARKRLAPDYDEYYNPEGDERISALGRQYYAGNTDEFEDHVTLWEVYVPRHRQVITLADAWLAGPDAENYGGKPEPLRVTRWLGPDDGPYHMLGYGMVPGNIMPKAPIQDLIPLHEAANRQLRKLIRQSDRQKEVTTVGGGNTEDGDRVMNANDGDMVPVNNVEQIKPIITGMINPQLFQMFGAVKDLFSWAAGNLDMMGGLSPQSKTATQDKLLAANASGQINDMQDTTVTFTSSVIKALCWYWHHDPHKVMTSEHSLPGMPSISIARHVQPQQRQQVKFEDLRVKIDPYSMQHQTPQSRLQGLTQLVMQIYTPLAQIAQQQGVTLDLNEFFRMVGEYMDMPEVGELLTLREPPVQDTQSSSDKPSMPAQTQRSYVRENQPGRTEQGDSRARVAAMLGMDQGGASQNGQTNGTH